MRNKINTTKTNMTTNLIYRSRRRIATMSLWVFLSSSLFSIAAPLSPMATTSLADGVIAVPTSGSATEPTTRPYVDDDAASGSSASGSGASGQSATVTYKYNKKVSYSKIRKKLRSKRTFTFLFEDVSKTSSKLTQFGFYEHTWNFAHTGYGYMNEQIMLYPMIKASKDGSSSKLSFGIHLLSYVQIINPTSRKYKKMIISGGGEKITLKGNTTSRMKIVGQFVKRKYMTSGTFSISSNKNAHEARIKKLKRILDAGNTKITVKDTAKKKTYKCRINDTKSASLKDFIKRYMNVLKKYRSK